MKSMIQPANDKTIEEFWNRKIILKCCN
jgi:hypothetical protein